MSQPFFTAELQRGTEGVFVPVAEAIKDVNAIITGQYDNLHDDVFLYIGKMSDIKNG
jgi:F0F1-type ATP synthase beta subunit